MAMGREVKTEIEQQKDDDWQREINKEAINSMFPVAKKQLFLAEAQRAGFSLEQADFLWKVLPIRKDQS